MTDAAEVLRIDQLRVYFSTRLGDVRAVDGVDLTIRKGETVGLVGESGSGKSVTARSIMRLVPMPPGRYAGGSINFQGLDLLSLDDANMRELRGGRIGMIFQDPMTFLNPVYTAGEQVAEAIRLHQRVSRSEARIRTIELFRTVGIPSPEERYGAYPHQLSGGMRQRVMIAIALSSQPELLIADEPTTALDVTIQAQILDLLLGLQQQLGMSVLLITHDLGVVAETCDRVAVMYAGQIVEEGPVETIFEQPEHPYTIGLINAIPRADLEGASPEPIPGSPPDLVSPPAGCRFHPRCPYAEPLCREVAPELRQVAAGHVAACHFAGTGVFERALDGAVEYGAAAS
jgi:oligopeptide/dipeptide ABC transporter ATP-binding protein